LIGKQRSGIHNLPFASKVVALVVRGPGEKKVTRDIIVVFKDMGPKRISDIHPKLMSLQYPLLFPYGEDGFTLEISYRSGRADNVTPPTTTTICWEALPRYKTIIKQRQ
jgi:hypothetical protein